MPPPKGNKSQGARALASLDTGAANAVPPRLMQAPGPALAAPAAAVAAAAAAAIAPPIAPPAAAAAVAPAIAPEEDDLPADAVLEKDDLDGVKFRRQQPKGRRLSAARPPERSASQLMEDAKVR